VLAQNQVYPPESVSHEMQGKVSVCTEIFVGGVKFDNVFDKEAGPLLTLPKPSLTYRRI